MPIAKVTLCNLQRAGWHFSVWAVRFVTELYSGLISDKDFTGRSGITILLDPNDSVMMYKVFLIADLLEKFQQLTQFHLS